MPQEAITSGKKRGMTPAIKIEIRRRFAVEPVIGHIKNGYRMDRNYLAGPKGDAINAVLAAGGYNFRLILKWLWLLLCLIVSMIHILGSENANHIICRKYILPTPAIETWFLRKI